MTETLVLAAGAPAAIAAIWLASRRSWSPAAADSRGIALQTVIVIVVMLVIAGGVSAVLLSRGGDVIGELEAQDVSATAEYNSEAECDALFPQPIGVSTYTAASGSSPKTCIATGTAADPVAASDCARRGGSFDRNAQHGLCTLTG